MTRTLMSIASAVLALTPMVHGLFGSSGTKVDTKADAQIHLYPFVSKDCTGMPVGSPYELKQGQCVNLYQANSIKPRFRPDHAGWVDEVNALRKHCHLKTFAAPDCLERNQTEKYRWRHSGNLPKNFERCLVPRGQHYQRDEVYSSSTESSGDEQERLEHSLQSAMFVCGNLENPEYLCTSTVEHTSWSMDSTYWQPHFSVHTATYTGSLSTAAHVTARSIDDTRPTLEPRMKPGREKKGVWMYHPWGHSLICYSCYPKKEHNYRKVECRAGIDYPADCGALPVSYHGKPTTHHTTMTSTTTITTTTHRTSMTAYSISVTETSRSQRAEDLHDISSSSSDSDSEHHMDIKLSQKKSWHTPVKFYHPFISGEEACADAEWEKRGRPESYVKIQHIHICDEKDRQDSQWIGLPQEVVHTKNHTTTSTLVINHTSTSTQAVMVTRRHDQL